MALTAGKLTKGRTFNWTTADGEDGIPEWVEGVLESRPTPFGVAWSINGIDIDPDSVVETKPLTLTEIFDAVEERIEQAGIAIIDSE